MSRQAVASVTVMRLPHLHPEAVRVEIDCRFSTTGITSIPGEHTPLTRAQQITMAVYAHEERCGECSTEDAHQRGDLHIRGHVDSLHSDLQRALVRQYAASRRN